MLGSAFLGKGGVDTIVLAVFFGLVMLTAVQNVSDRRSQTVIALALAIPWLCLTVLSILTGDIGIRLADSLLFVAFAFYVVAIMLRQVVTAKKVDFGILCRSVSIYLLLAITWAVSYEAIEILMPGSFSNAGQGIGVPFTEYLYFSLTTIASLGYGDITPTAAPARIWVTLEAVTGVFYMVVLVARLVSHYRP